MGIGLDNRNVGRELQTNSIQIDPLNQGRKTIRVPICRFTSGCGDVGSCVDIVPNNEDSSRMFVSKILVLGLDRDIFLLHVL